MSNEAEFVDELPEREYVNGHRRWFSRLEPLVERPGQWAILGRYPNFNTAGATASNLRRGHTNLPASGQWEFAARKAEGEYRVYGRYLGPEI